VEAPKMPGIETTTPEIRSTPINIAIVFMDSHSSSP
jgi:hypothetical protein